MQHIVIHYAGAFDDFAALGDDRHFFIDGRWSQQTIRAKMIRESEDINLKHQIHGQPPVYARDYMVLGQGDSKVYPMPYIVKRHHTFAFQAYERNVLLSRKLGEPITVFIDGIQAARYQLEGRRVIILGSEWAQGYEIENPGTTSNAPYAVARHLIQTAVTGETV